MISKTNKKPITAKEMCEGCGKVFDATANEFFCPACRKKKQSESAKQRKLNQIGTEARKKKAQQNKEGTPCSVRKQSS